MKSIKINGLSEPDKESVYTDQLCYKVNLGNGIVKRFSNKAQAQKFLNEVSKYLTYKLHECNELYISVFTYYRRAWFYFDHNKPLGRNKADLKQKDRLCDDVLKQVSDIFNTLYHRANWANGNHFVFVHFNNITNGLQMVVENLQFLYANKSSPVIDYELQILKTKIIYCQRTIDKYCVELENDFTGLNEAQIINLGVG